MAPLLVLLVGIVFVVFTITVLKIHPFLSLISAGFLVGLLSPIPLNMQEEVESGRKLLLFQLDTGEITAEEHQTLLENLAENTKQRLEKIEEGSGQWAVDSLEITAKELGNTAASIAIIIVLAAIIGQCLMESGAADKITRRFLALLGIDRAPIALMGSAYIFSVPVFFDTVIFLLVPLARALRLRTGKNFVLFICAIATGSVITHSLVPPTPGPLLMADNLSHLGLDLGAAILFGFLLGLLPAAASLIFASYINRRYDIPVREAMGADRAELEAMVERHESELPGLLPSILPVVLPVGLISGSTILSTLAAQKYAAFPSWLLGSAAFFGNKNMALLIGALFASLLLIRYKNLQLSEFAKRIEPAMMSAGIIILITSAGGAFGKMLARTGIGGSLDNLTGDGQFGAAGYILVAWILAAIMKTAQGSGTVAIITASGMMAAILTPDTISFHPIYLFAAIGFGSMFITWMNDSGFWVVCKMSGFTEKETLSIWTPLLAVISIVGLIEILILSAILPFHG
jgi:GntP family gluconate:H+ symporter